MPQPRKSSGRRVPTARKPAPTSPLPAPKRAKPKAAAGEPAGVRSAAGPVNPDSMSAEVIEFITAVDDYKRQRGRPFPSWSEILEIVKQLGYRKAS